MPWGDRGGGWNGGDGGPWGQPPSGNGGRGPGAGKPGGEGPRGPDLDEWVRQMQDRLRRYSGGGNEFRGAILIAAILLVLWLCSGIYFVKADEEGVVKRFGAYARTSGPGLNIHLPYPFETVQTPRVTAINRVEVGYHSGRGGHGETGVSEESLMLTGDENIIDVDFEVQWKISSAPDYLYQVRDPEVTVKAVAESAMREVIGLTPIASVLAEGKLKVEQDAKELLQNTLDTYKAGIEVVSVNLLKADPPSQVIDAFRDVQTARADRETARNEAQAYRNDIIPKARGAAQQMVLEAEAYKQQVIAQAQGDASRFLAVYNQYRQAKDVTRRRLYIENMEDILQGVPKVIVDSKGTQGVLPYLPLADVNRTARAPKAEEGAK